MKKAERRKGKRADYILRYTRDFPIAVVEAKSEDEPAAAGLQQSKDYAEILKLKFAYATNCTTIIEFDYITGLEREIPAFPTPAQLWARLRAYEKLTDNALVARLLTPFSTTASCQIRPERGCVRSTTRSTSEGRSVRDTCERVVRGEAAAAGPLDTAALRTQTGARASGLRPASPPEGRTRQTSSDTLRNAHDEAA